MKVLSRSTVFFVPFFAAGLAFGEPPLLTITSPDFGSSSSISAAHVFNEYGCTGQNKSPALEWRNIPTGTKSFAITMFDLDERGSPSGWWHWIVYDLPATTDRLPENAGAPKSTFLPAGAVEGRTDMGQDAYHGPCPDKGQPAHRYQITIYALSVAKLPVPPEASGAMVTWTAHDYILAKSTLTARYGR